MLDVHKLQIFAAVAQYLSFTRAAQALFLTQSAVSHAISSLERQLDTPLLRREGKRIALTSPGHVLLDHTRRLLAALDDAQTAVQLAAKPDRGSLRIGASPAACQYLLPESLREFRASYPHFQLSIAVHDSPLIAQHLLEGSIDLGLLVRTGTTALNDTLAHKRGGGQLAYHPLFTDELGVLLSPRHPFALARKVDRDQLPHQHFILYTRTSATFHLIERHLLRLSTPLRNFTELGSLEAIKELVKLGLGITIAAPWIASPEIAQGALVWLKLPRPTPPAPSPSADAASRKMTASSLRRHWSIASRTGRHLSIAEQTFLALCRAAAQNLSQSSTALSHLQPPRTV